MLLIDFRQKCAVQEIAVYIANQAIALVDRLLLCAPIPGNGHPTGIANGNTLFHVVTNDSSEHTDRDVIDTTNP